MADCKAKGRMATVHFTTALERFVPGLESIEVSGDTAFEVIAEIEKHFPGVRGYILEENGALRKHVNIFINDHSIEDTRHLSDAVACNDEIHIIQALSGG